MADFVSRIWFSNTPNFTNIHTMYRFDITGAYIATYLQRHFPHKQLRNLKWSNIWRSKSKMVIKKEDDDLWRIRRKTQRFRLMGRYWGSRYIFLNSKRSTQSKNGATSDCGDRDQIASSTTRRRWNLVSKTMFWIKSSPCALGFKRLIHKTFDTSYQVLRQTTYEKIPMTERLPIAM